MIDDIDALVASYEGGTLTRRQLLLALAAIAAPTAAGAQPAGSSVMKGRNLLASRRRGESKDRTAMDSTCREAGS